FTAEHAWVYWFDAEILKPGVHNHRSLYQITDWFPTGRELAHATTLAAQNTNRLIDGVFREIQDRAKTDGTFAAADGEKPGFKESFVELLACVLVRQIKRDHHSTATHRGN